MRGQIKAISVSARKIKISSKSGFAPRKKRWNWEGGASWSRSPIFFCLEEEEVDEENGDVMDVMNMEEEMVLRSLDPGQRSAGSTLEYRGSNVSWQHVLECGGSNLGWHRARSFHPLDSNSPCRSFLHKIFPGSSGFPLHNVFSICAAKCATFPF